MKATNSQDLQSLWLSWKKNKDEQAANDLIEHYMYLVHYHVERFASSIPDSYDKNDLKSLGLLGLYDALNKFELDRNLKFDTYATIRIRGSIIDGLRKEDWLPRTLREQSKKIEKVSEELEQRLMRTPDAADIAKALGKEPEEIETIAMNAVLSNMLSIDATYPSQNCEDAPESAVALKDENAVDPDESVTDAEQKKELAKQIKSLNENEQLVVSLFYHEELTLTEIGQVLDLTTSRISQIHKRALFKLRKALVKENFIRIKTP